VASDDDGQTIESVDNDNGNGHTGTIERYYQTMHESLSNFCIYIHNERYGKIMLSYPKFLGFSLTFGGKPSDRFTTFEIIEGSNAITYLNLEVREVDEGNSDLYKKPNLGKTRDSEDFGRIIFHTENVDTLYSYMKQDEYISKSVVFENESTNAPWGERFFHIRESNGYQFSFAQP
jgi:hypothetical protein